MAKTIAIASARGGCGKTFIAVNLAAALSLRGSRTQLVDLDVEAPNTYALLRGGKLELVKEVELFTPSIDASRCTSCRKCMEVCETGAILFVESRPMVIQKLCSGCRACFYACSSGAIAESKRVVGYVYRYEQNVAQQLDIVVGELRAGEEHVLPVVIETKEFATAMEGYDYRVLDTAPGVGMPVAASLEGSDLVIVVVEPSPTGIEGARRTVELCRALNLRYAAVVNKASDTAKASIEDLGAEVLCEVPMSMEVVESYCRGKPIVLDKPSSSIAKTFLELAERLESY